MQASPVNKHSCQSQRVPGVALLLPPASCLWLRLLSKMMMEATINLTFPSLRFLLDYK